jgi:uncharacterized protein (TIGR00255 family)
MTSMTGFACREWAGDDISVSVEIRGYNNRFLEIYVNTPPWLSYLEPKVRELIGGFCGRGKVEVAVRLREQNAPVTVSVNVNAAGAYMEAVSGLASGLGIDEKLSLSTLIGMEGVLEVEKKRDNERYWNLIEPLLREAAGIFQAEREREGKHTREDILKSLAVIEASLAVIGGHVAGLENSIKENITARFKELVENSGGGMIIDENRILAETAVLLMKYTVAEEISRLSAHLAEFRSAADSERPGRKLDFLCQEINREINTIGSKSAILEVNRAVVEMKESLENIREQLRNIE